jgi:hypothetical protein
MENFRLNNANAVIYFAYSKTRTEGNEMAAINNINIHEFNNRFGNEYEFLYDNRDNVAGFHDAVREGDKFIKEHAEFVREFCKYRGDIISSDREVAAFMFALSSMID